METMKVDALIKPVIDKENDVNPFLTTKEYQTSIEVDPNTLLKDVCKVILEKNGIGHLSITSKAFIEAPGSRSINCETFYPDKEINIDIVKNLVGNPFVIVIYAHGKVEDFCEANLRKATFSSLLDFLQNNESFVENSKVDPVVKKFIEYIKSGSGGKSLYQNLPTIDGNILFNGNNYNNYVHKTPLHTKPSIKIGTEPVSHQFGRYLSPQLYSPNLGVNIDLYNCAKGRSPILGSPLLRTPLVGRSESRLKKSKLDQLKEMNTLKQVYQKKKHLTTNDIIQFTKKLNSICKRPGNPKITPHQVSYWLKSKKFKDIEQRLCQDRNVSF